MDRMQGWLKETAVFMLVSQMIFHFMPGEKYEKYARMLAAILVLAQLCVPLLSLGKEGTIQEFLQLTESGQQEQELFSQKLEELKTAEEKAAQNDLQESVKERIFAAAAAAGKTVRRVELKDGRLRIAVSPQTATKGEGGVEVEGVQPVETPDRAAGGQEPLAEIFARELGMSPEEVEVVEVR